NKIITIRYDKKSYLLTGNDLKAYYNIAETVDEVQTKFENLWPWEKKSLIENPKIKKVDLKVKYDKNVIENVLNKMEGEINRNPSDARIIMKNPGRLVVVDYVKGEKLNKNATRFLIIKQIEADTINKIEISPTIDITEPLITEKQLKSVDSIISYASTVYRGSPEGRSKNIELAVAQINGTLLMPGEIFSFNEVTGKRDEAAGYQNAPVIVKDNLEDGIGGGVCQVSSTLYNAVIRAGISPLQRRNHTLAPAYVKPGLDATVSDYIDFKFKNTLEYPIYIEGITSNGKVIFNLYSNASLKSIKYDIQCEIIETSKAVIKKLPDITLDEGKLVNEEPPHNGYKVNVFIITRKDGKEISRELLTRDSYKKVDGIIRVGKKKKQN
ncbi:MAG: VanW family protein, partial [Bacillota bacterium]|nr:VanW family protein [Bacillota bacterium]